MREHQRCATCGAYNRQKYECRKNAPKIVQNPPRGGFVNVGYFPMIEPDEWCLDWEAQGDPQPAR